MYWPGHQSMAGSQQACQVHLDCASDTTQDHQCCVAPHVVLHSNIHEQRCTFDCHDRLEEAFSEVEHKVPEGWQNVTGGPTMTLRSLDMRMPNCRYAHTLTCFQPGSWQYYAQATEQLAGPTSCHMLQACHRAPQISAE